MCGPQVRFCERLGGAIPRAYSTANRRVGRPLEIAAIRGVLVAVPQILYRER
jgi:hypothetical protein